MAATLEQISVPSETNDQCPTTSRFPAPYKAMLAICSDLDETPDAEVYFELIRFLNTTENTSMGRGVGLEVGNTIYFDMPPGHFSYWSASDRDREKIRILIRSGHIDCLHSFGDLATTRAHAQRALDELQRHDCGIKVWIDHAQAPSNFGADIMRGHGDDRDHAVYHADLTLDYGIKYVWRGRVTSVIGQDRPLSFRGILNASHPVASLKTVCKEAAKQTLARVGNTKYHLHAANKTLQQVRLRDGGKTQEFLRFNPAWLGVSKFDTGYGIGQVLTTEFLERFVARGGTGILYTHLGKLRPGHRGFDEHTVAAFRRLAAFYNEGKILVTTTRRLLEFCEQPTFFRSQQLNFPHLSI